MTRRRKVAVGVVILSVSLLLAPWLVGDARLPSLRLPARVTPVNVSDVYNPVAAGEETPPGFRQLLTRDRIHPIYAPVFTDADDVDWPDESLVIGVAGDNAAKAYPVTVLNQREMVIDEIEGLPILVSW